LKTKIIRILAVLTVMAFVLATGGVIYADSHADAWAEANGNTGNTEISACDESYAQASYDANGNTYSESESEDIDFPFEALAAAYASATSDGDSNAEADASVEGDEHAAGWVTGTSDATATNGGDAYAGVLGEVEENIFHFSSIMNITGNAIADGDGAVADVSIGDGEAYGAWIENNSSGSIDITANATAEGQDTRADVEVDEAGIWFYSVGDVTVNADATATGSEAYAYTDIEYAGIGNYSVGTINVDAQATATGDGSYAEIDDSRAIIENFSSGAIDSYIYANATDGGTAYSTSFTGLGVYGHESFVTQEVITGTTGSYTSVSVANADGSGSEAYSNVAISDGAPAGFYYGYDIDGTSVAVGVLYSDGTDVWAFNFANATAGGSAMADIEANPSGVVIDAVVGQGIPDFNNVQ
jgi:hypothetical protein